MRRFNLLAAEPEYDDSAPEGYRAGMDRFGPKIGAAQLGGSVYELPPGQSICPYHYEYPEEEWLFVLTGRVDVRTPEGEEELGPMEVVCFPFGPTGAHKVTNRRDAVYPDSGKMLANTGNPEDRLMARRESAVDYYDGEA